MRAVVDIGSNSVKFLCGRILRGAPELGPSSSRVTRLAEKMKDNGGLLTEEALKRTQAALQDFSQQLKGIPREVVATAAARKAKNVDRLAELVQRELGCPMNVISGSEEAEWSRTGAQIAAKAAFPNFPNFIFVDMGGASTEISFSADKSPKHSFPVGAVSFMEDLKLHEMPISDSIWSQAKKEVHQFFPTKNLAELKDYSKTVSNPKMIAVGGTLLIAAKIATHGQSNFNSYGVSVTRKEFAKLNEEVRLMDQAARFRLPGMEPGREDILCGGLLAIDYLMQSFAQEEIFITNWGLRHGLLFGKA